MNEFYLKLALVFLAAGAVSYIMHRLQKKKEADADRQFQLTLKSYGMSDKPMFDPFTKKPFVPKSRSEQRRMNIMNDQPVNANMEVFEKTKPKKKKKSTKRGKR
jgi:hypothetical protein